MIALAKYTQKQWAAIWLQEGGDPTKADLASAIVMAESGGDEKAHSPGGCCYGGYQMHREYHDVNCATKARCATRDAIKTSKNGTDWSPWEAFTNGAYQQYLGKTGGLKGPVGVPKATNEDCTPVGAGSTFGNVAAGAGAGAIAGSIIPGAGTLAGGAIGGAIGAVGAGVGGNVLAGCSPLQGANPLSGIDKLAAAAEAIARLVENLFTAHFWVRFGKGLLGAVLVIYALQGMLKATLGIELPIGAVNGKAFKTAATLAGK